MVQHASLLVPSTNGMAGRVRDAVTVGPLVGRQPLHCENLTLVELRSLQSNEADPADASEVPLLLPGLMTSSTLALPLASISLHNRLESHDQARLSGMHLLGGLVDARHRVNSTEMQTRQSA